MRGLRQGLRAYPARRDPWSWGEVFSRHPMREVDDGSGGRRRWLADAGLVLGAGRGVAAGAAGAPVGLSPAAGSRPGRDGRDLVGAADGDAVERAEGARALFLVGGPSALSGVGAS